MSAVSASDTMIETIASPMGRSAETSVPKTRSSTISATGMPIASPLARSDSAALLTSCAIDACPVTRTVKPLESPADCASASTFAM